MPKKLRQPSRAQALVFKAAIDRAIKMLGARGVAETIGVKESWVFTVRKRGTGIRGADALAIEKRTGGVVLRYQLDPLAYPPEDYSWLASTYPPPK